MRLINRKGLHDSALRQDATVTRTHIRRQIQVLFAHRTRLWRVSVHAEPAIGAAIACGHRLVVALSCGCE
jgi:hypothetical protein